MSIHPLLVSEMWVQPLTEHVGLRNRSFANVKEPNSLDLPVEDKSEGVRKGVKTFCEELDSLPISTKEVTIYKKR